MAGHLDEMLSYIRIAGETELLEDECLTDDIDPPKTNQDSKLIEELHNIVFKLQSYRELNEDQNYALGIEEGLSLAAEMITRLIEKYGRSEF